VPGGSAPDLLSIIHKGQTYRLLALEPVRRHDGQPAVLTVWSSHCADCGEPFRFKLSVRARFVPNRRCRLHARPGVRVRSIAAPVGSLANDGG
jgi:hypothetical protein